jgi:hypothetical protein
MHHYVYMVVCQEGSMTAEGTPIRPGTILCIGVDVLDRHAKKIAWPGKVHEADTPENAVKRAACWDGNTYTEEC